MAVGEDLELIGCGIEDKVVGFTVIQFCVETTQ